MSKISNGQQTGSTGTHAVHRLGRGPNGTLSQNQKFCLEAAGLGVFAKLPDDEFQGVVDVAMCLSTQERRALATKAKEHGIITSKQSSTTATTPTSKNANTSMEKEAPIRTKYLGWDAILNKD